MKLYLQCLPPTSAARQRKEKPLFCSNWPWLSQPFLPAIQNCQCFMWLIYGLQ